MTKKPILNIITRCTRPQNLDAIFESLLPAFKLFSVTWWVVCEDRIVKSEKDIKKYPSTNVRIYSKEQSKSVGFGMMNEVLNEIKTGWVWGLDDDNTAAPGFFEELAKHDNYNVVVFGQQLPYGRYRACSPEQTRVCQIDQAQYVVKREFIGNTHFKTEYGFIADGIFIEEIRNRNKTGWKYVDLPLTNYNALSNLRTTFFHKIRTMVKSNIQRIQYRRSL